MKTSVLLAFVCAMGLSLLSVPAHAQATRTWVSGVGDDANPCSRTAPCKTFAGAISKTAPAGEINVLDPGGFGAVTITKAITISSEGPEAGVLVSGTNGIVISAGPTDQVVLKGLDIEGLGTGLDGVKFLTGKAVYVVKCTIHHFTGNGVNANSSTAGARIFVKDSLITQNAIGVLSSGNGTSNVVSVSDTVLDGNTTNAVKVGGAGNVVALVRSILSNSPTEISNGGGSVVSFGPSNVISPTPAAGVITSTSPFL